MYLKVYYGPDKKDATIEQVEKALPKDMEGLNVFDGSGIACVDFPEGSPYSDWQRVQKILQDAGFETE